MSLHKLKQDYKRKFDELKAKATQKAVNREKVLKDAVQPIVECIRNAIEIELTHRMEESITVYGMSAPIQFCIYCNHDIKPDVYDYYWHRHSEPYKMIATNHLLSYTPNVGDYDVSHIRLGVYTRLELEKNFSDIYVSSGIEDISYRPIDSEDPEEFQTLSVTKLSLTVKLQDFL